MQPFETLSYNEQLARLTEFAGLALRAYGYPDAALHSVAYINNAVFEVHAPNGGHFALRLHRPGHKRLEWIKSELVWLGAIGRDTTLCVPHPIQSLDAEPIVYASVRGLSEPIICALFAWIAGDFERTETLSLQRVREVGKYLSRLHSYSMSFDPPDGFARPRLDEQGLSGAEFAFNLGAGAALFTDDHRRTFHEVEERFRHVMRELGISKESFGLIHADFLMKNILFRGDEICAIDFDDCSWGYFLTISRRFCSSLKMSHVILNFAMPSGKAIPRSTLYRIRIAPMLRPSSPRDICFRAGGSQETYTIPAFGNVPQS